MKGKNWVLGAATGLILVGSLLGVGCKKSSNNANANATKTAQSMHGTSTPHATGTEQMTTGTPAAMTTGTPEAMTTPAATMLAGTATP